MGYQDMLRSGGQTAVKTGNLRSLGKVRFTERKFPLKKWSEQLCQSIPVGWRFVRLCQGRQRLFSRLCRSNS